VNREGNVMKLSGNFRLSESGLPVLDNCVEKNITIELLSSDKTVINHYY